ncbi:MAG: glycosyl hydrolase [Deltaproteobacteria bacterium]|nr:glycosyl hydrolase [Deltaproteobacteria bacterium]
MTTTRLLPTLAACLFVGGAAGCPSSEPAGGDADVDSDAETDVGADGDADGDGDIERDGEVDAETDGGEVTLLRERSCVTEFAYRPPGAVGSVELAGEWNGWIGEPMAESGGEYRAARELEPGIYCYKYVVDGEWIFDPGNSYQAYCDDTANSGVRVPDRTLPLLTLDGDARAAGDGFSARVLFSAGCRGAGPAAVTATLVHDFAESPIAAVFDESDWSLEVELTGLAAGKYTVRVEARDEAGREAERLLLPFWIEAEAFSWRDAVIYMILTDRFVNGEPGNDPSPEAGAEPTADWYGGDLAGITSRIAAGYFDDLGVRALWITPFNTGAAGSELDASGVHRVTGYHGYWPVEPREVDPRLGTADDLRALVAAAHARGIRILMDLVVNHVHEQHRYFREHPEWFNDGCLCGSDGCDWTTERLTCLFAAYMPDIDWRQEAASEQFIADALWWLETFDLDGFRIDAVKHVDDLAVFNLGTRVAETFERSGTDYYLDGETAMGWAGDDLEANREQYETISRYIGPNGLDGQFDFVLYHAVAYRVFAYDGRGYLHLDYWTLQSQLQYPAGSIMTPYLGSHDTPRFLSQCQYRGQDAEHPVERVNNKWANLVEPPSDDEPYERARLGFCWLLAVPGAPLVYQGDEYGDYGGADPDNRHMFRTGAELTSRESAFLDDVRDLGRARRDLAALRRGAYRQVGSTETMLAFVREAETDGALVVLNNGPLAAALAVDLSGTALAGAGGLHDELGWGATAVVVGPTATVTLPSRSCAVFAP